MDGMKRPKRTGAHGGKRLMLACGLCLSAGCMSPGTAPGKLDQPASGPVVQVQAAWRNEVVVTADVVHQGAPLPGLAGRVYLFGSEPGYPIKGNGKVIVDLYDLGKFGQKSTPKMLQRFVFDPVTLDRLFRHDLIGWGYTLFLPWPEYNGEVERVRLKVCYQPDKGTPVFGPDSEVSIRPKERASIKETQSSVPVGQAPPAAGNGNVAGIPGPAAGNGNVAGTPGPGAGNGNVLGTPGPAATPGASGLPALTGPVAQLTNNPLSSQSGFLVQPPTAPQTGSSGQQGARPGVQPAAPAAEMSTNCEVVGSSLFAAGRPQASQ